MTLCMLAASGIRAAFGVYIKPMEHEFGWTRGGLSGAAAISLLLLGAVGPFIGRLADTLGRAPGRHRVPGAARRRRARHGVRPAAVARSTSRPVSSWRVGAGGARDDHRAPASPRGGSRRAAVWSIGIVGAAPCRPASSLVIPLATGSRSAYGWRTSYLWLGAGLLVARAPGRDRASFATIPRIAASGRTAPRARRRRRRRSPRASARAASRVVEAARFPAVLAPDGDVLRLRLHVDRHGPHALRAARARAQLHGDPGRRPRSA